jgi:hypothetical protein
MAASTAGALKAYLEAQGLGVSVYRDTAPETASLPYITVTESISVTPDAAFNAFDDPQGHVREVVQVDIWQQWRDPDTNALVESYSLPDAVTLALTGSRLSSAPTPTPGVTLQGVRRLLEPPDEPSVVHHAITVELRRQLSRTGA